MVTTSKLQRGIIAFLLLSGAASSFSPSPSPTTNSVVRKTGNGNINSSGGSSIFAAKNINSSVPASPPQQMEKARAAIAEAISIGAPAYNAGDIPGCAKVYRETALQLSSMLPQNLRTGLEETNQQKFGDANEEAWAFRKQFDLIMEYQAPFVPISEAESDDDTKLEPFTIFQIPEKPLVVNDNVMGGISRGEWMLDSSTFKGTTSLANNGGFSSLRWRFDTVQNWSNASGIYLIVRHSEPQTHTFRLILKDTTCERVRGANFKVVFANPEQTTGNEVNPILIPFESFEQMEQMGRKLSGVPPFNRAEVTELGLMAIKPSVVGDFELTIDVFGLYYQ